MMDEAILIEIAQRFRRLEDAVGEGYFPTEQGREGVDAALEACREDMVNMQELIRKAGR